MNPVTLGLLIFLDGLEQLSHGNGGLQFKTCTHKQTQDSLLVSLRKHTLSICCIGNQSQTTGYSLAMVKLRRRLLDGMRQRMTQIKQASVARLALVALDDIGLNLYCPIDQFHKQLNIAM